jgi:hypothetical protein
MTKPNTPYVSSVEEEFSRFAKARLEGLELTEDDHILGLYREAIDEGLRQLKESAGGPPCS